MFRMPVLAFLVICLTAVGVILYAYLKPSRGARKAKQLEKLDKDINDYLNAKREE